MPNQFVGSEPPVNTVAFSRRHPTPEVALLTIRGELDISTAGVLRRELDALLSVPATRVEIDLSGVVFMDSSALSALVSARERAYEQAQTLALLEPSPVCVKVLHITGLDRVFELI